MRVSQQQRLGQHIAMTPQLVQSIRLLQLSALELEQEIRQMLEANVMLESAEEEPAIDEAKESTEEAQDNNDDVEHDDEIELATDDDDAPASSASDTRDTMAAPNGVSLQARALAQLALTVRDAREAEIVLAIVEAIDDNGYLERPLADIGASIAPPATSNELEFALSRVQQLEPAGYGARDLRECLLIQLTALPVRTPARVLAMAIVGQALDMATVDQVDALARRYEVETESIEEALRLIRSLNPYPGRAPNDVAEAIIPDLVLRVRGRQCSVDLNTRSIPGIRVNRVYERLLGDCGPGADTLRTQLNEARWLVRGLEMRNQTLLRAARVIFTRQAGFAIRGDEGLVPLTLREVADAIGMHESTVSRITANKYVSTPRGLLPLRHFFCSQVTVRDGVEASGAAVRAIVRRLIESENPASPLCDGTIAALLSRQGIGVARRTVAKYREAMKIAPAKERRVAASRPMRKAS
ncbi:MAG TPA: RNA polymerase factor sigma-54 [Nevskiaceae bacterium]|nr:RNA polymerase factor sigma-54 [Nevskiaceae bacterium]